MPNIEANGARLEYIEKGSGTPVIFVHGSVSDYRAWNAQVEQFAQRYRVVAYSRRYHFPNPWTGEGMDYTVRLHAEDLAALITTLGLGRVHLIGSSYGAYTSLITAIRNPNLVRSLVLGEPPVLPLLAENPDNPLHLASLIMKSPSTAIKFISFGVRSIKPAQGALRRGDLEKGVQSFVNGVLGKGGFEQLPSSARATMMDNAQALKAELLGPGFDRFPVEDARRCSIPTLLVYGDRSPGFFRSISDRLMSILPSAQRVTIPNASHSMHRDNPDAYNKIVLEFLRKYD